MDAPCKIQGSIHVFRLVNNMCPGKWVHIIIPVFYFEYKKKREYNIIISEENLFLFMKGGFTHGINR